MKIVSFGDIHMAISSMAKIAVELATADLAILSGDLTNFGGRTEAQQVLAAVRSYCPAVLALPGNLDRPEVVHFLHNEQMDLHGVHRRFENLEIFGCGGLEYHAFSYPVGVSRRRIGSPARTGCRRSWRDSLATHGLPHAAVRDSA